MGNCIYCGTPAGLLRKHHRKCKETFEVGKKQIISQFKSGISDQTSSGILEQEILKISQSHLIDKNNLHSILIDAWEDAVEVALDDSILTEAEESVLSDISEHFLLTQQELNRNGSYSKVIKGAVLRDILEGKIPERITV